MIFIGERGSFFTAFHICQFTDMPKNRDELLLKNTLRYPQGSGKYVVSLRFFAFLKRTNRKIWKDIAAGYDKRFIFGDDKQVAFFQKPHIRKPKK